MISKIEEPTMQELYLVTGAWVIAEVRPHPDKKKIILQDPLKVRQVRVRGQGLALEIQPLIPASGPGSALELPKDAVVVPMEARPNLVKEWCKAAGRPYVEPIHMMPPDPAGGN